MICIIGGSCVSVCGYWWRKNALKKLNDQDFRRASGHISLSTILKISYPNYQKKFQKIIITRLLCTQNLFTAVSVSLIGFISVLDGKAPLLVLIFGEVFVVVVGDGPRSFGTYVRYQTLSAFELENRLVYKSTILPEV